MRNLTTAGCNVIVVPATTSAEDVLAMNPDGVFLSNGPGDPEPISYAQETIRLFPTRFYPAGETLFSDFIDGVNPRKSKTHAGDPASPEVVVGDVFGHLLGKGVRVRCSGRMGFVDGQIVDRKRCEAKVEAKSVDGARRDHPLDLQLTRRLVHMKGSAAVGVKNCD